MLEGSPVLCSHCKREQATTLDHDPPVAMHKHRDGTGCCRLIPSCETCNRAGGELVRLGLWRPGASPLPAELEPEPEPDGLAVSHPVWRVPWLKGFRRPPRDATWPRLMSVPHRRAVGSIGPEFIRWSKQRTGMELRWWQRLVSTRLLEVDDAERLVWEALILSMARQLGKSWLLRELCLWRIHQGERFGEPQDVVHTGKDLAICKEVQRPARSWAKLRRGEYKVREVNGDEQIEYLPDGSRWMLRAKESAYGYSVSQAAVDEAWKVRPHTVDESITPTMAERDQPQLLLVSTAHRLSTSLMLGRRQLALSELRSGEGDLLIEWSAPRLAAIDDLKAWRAASPHWTDARARMVKRQLQAAREGSLEDDDEPDPVESFRSQWLNQWPQRLVGAQGPTEELVPERVWEGLAEPGVISTGPVWIAVEDDYGVGAAVAAVARLADGRLEVDGWACEDWDSAISDVQALGTVRQVKELQVGASLLDRVPAGMRPRPKPAAAGQTRAGLALFRDLVYGGQVTYEPVYELSNAVVAARVREAPTGLVLIPRGQSHLVRALVWALAAAHKQARTPAIR